MTLLKKHPQDKLSQYADGELSVEESRDIEEHLATCADCGDEVAFIRDLDAGLLALPKDALLPQGPHLDSTTLVAYEAGDVDEETARHLRAHVFRCDQCAEKFYALRRARPKIVEVWLRATRDFLHCISALLEGIAAEPLRALAPTRGPGGRLYLPYEIGETFADDEGQEATVVLWVEPGLKPERIRMELRSTSLPKGWVARVGGQILPLTKNRVAVGENLPYGFYDIALRKGTKDENEIGRFRITIEPFGLSDGIETAIELLQARDYDLALAILDDAAERYSDSRDVWDLRCMALALAARETQMGRTLAVRSGDFEQVVKRVLAQTTERFGNGFASSLAAAVINPAQLTPDLFERTARELASVTTLSVVKLLWEGLSNTQQGLSNIRQDIMDLFEIAESQSTQLTASIKELQRAVDAIRNDTTQALAEKVTAIDQSTARALRDIANRHTLPPDSARILSDRLGTPCWQWLPNEVQGTFTAGETVYRTFESIDVHMDFTAALSEYGRALELLLNNKLRTWCTEIQTTVKRTEVFKKAVVSRFPRLDPSWALDEGGSLSPLQIVALLRIGRAIRERFKHSFNPAIEKVLTPSADGSDVALLETIAYVSVVRNKAVHKGEFTSYERMQLIRKVVAALAEHSSDPELLLKWIRGSPWFSRGESKIGADWVSAHWSRYPGIVQLLFRLIALDQ